MRIGPVTVPAYIPTTQVYSLSSQCGAFRRRLDEGHMEPTIDHGVPVRHLPWRQALLELPTLRREEDRVRKGGYYGYTVFKSKLARGQKTVIDVLSSIHKHDKILALLDIVLGRRAAHLC